MILGTSVASVCQPEHKMLAVSNNSTAQAKGALRARTFFSGALKRLRLLCAELAATMHITAASSCASNSLTRCPALHHRHSLILGSLGAMTTRRRAPGEPRVTTCNSEGQPRSQVAMSVGPCRTNFSFLQFRTRSPRLAALASCSLLWASAFDHLLKLQEGLFGHTLLHHRGDGLVGPAPS